MLRLAPEQTPNGAREVEARQESWGPFVVMIAVVAVRSFVYFGLVAFVASYYERVHGESRSEEHTSELQSRQYLVCRLLLENKHTTSVSPPPCRRFEIYWVHPLRGRPGFTPSGCVVFLPSRGTPLSCGLHLLRVP